MSLVHRLAEQQPRRLYTATLVVDVLYAIPDAADPSGRTSEVPGHDALLRMPAEVSSLKDLGSYLSRTENYFLEWRDPEHDPSWEDDEGIMQVLAHIDQLDVAPDTLASMIKSGLAEYALGTKLADLEMSQRLCQIIDAHTDVLEHAGHRITVSKQARINFEPGKVRVREVSPGLTTDQIYVTGERKLYRPMTPEQAERMLHVHVF